MNPMKGRFAEPLADWKRVRLFGISKCCGCKSLGATGFNRGFNKSGQNADADFPPVFRHG